MCKLFSTITLFFYIQLCLAILLPGQESGQNRTFLLYLTRCQSDPGRIQFKNIISLTERVTISEIKKEKIYRWFISELVKGGTGITKETEGREYLICLLWRFDEIETYLNECFSSGVLHVDDFLSFLSKITKKNLRYTDIFSEVKNFDPEISESNIQSVKKTITQKYVSEKIFSGTPSQNQKKLAIIKEFFIGSGRLSGSAYWDETLGTLLHGRKDSYSYKEKLSDEDLQLLIENSYDNKITAELIGLVNGFFREKKLQTAAFPGFFSNYLILFRHYSVINKSARSDVPLFMVSPTGVTETQFITESKKIISEVSMLFNNPSAVLPDSKEDIIKKYIEAVSAFIGGKEISQVNAAYVWNYRFLMQELVTDSREKENFKREFYQFLSKSYPGYSSYDLIFDAAPSGDAFLHCDIDSFFLHKELFDYILTLTRRRVYNIFAEMNSIVMQKFNSRTAEFFNKNSDGAFPKTAAGGLLAAELLTYYREYYRKFYEKPDNKNTPHPFNSAIWNVFTEPPEIYNEFLSYLSSDPVISKLSYEIFKCSPALEYLLEHVCITSSYSPAEPAGKIFYRLFFLRYLNDARESGVFESVISKIKNHRNAGTRSFYTAFINYSINEIDEMDRPGNLYIDETRRAQFFKFLLPECSENPIHHHFYEKLLLWTASRYAQFNPIEMQTETNTAAEATLEEEFFSEIIRRTTMLNYGIDTVREQELSDLILRALEEVEKNSLSQVREKLMRILRVKFIEELYKNTKIHLTRIYLFIETLMGKKNNDSLAQYQKLEEFTPEMLNDLTKFLEVIPSINISGYLQGTVPAFNAASNMDEKLSLVIQFQTVINGIHSFFSQTMKPADVRNVHASAERMLDFLVSLPPASPLRGRVDTSALLEKCVRTAVKIIFNSNPAHNTEMADNFTDHYLSKMKMLSDSGAAYPGLISDVTKVYFFRYRNDKIKMTYFFDQVFSLYKSIQNNDDGFSVQLQNSYIQAMLIIAGEKSVRPIIIKRISGHERSTLHKSLLDFLKNNPSNPEPLYFIYNIFGSEEFLNALKNNEIQKIIKKNFFSLRHVLKTVFTINWQIVTTTHSTGVSEGAAVIARETGAVHIDSIIREIVFDVYRFPGNTDTRRENGIHNPVKVSPQQHTSDVYEAVFLFFINESEIAAGNFIGKKNLLFFPRDNEAENILLRFTAGEGRDARTWYDFAQEAVYEFFRAGVIISRRNYAGLMIYLDFALRFKIRQMVIVNSQNTPVDGRTKDCDALWNDLEQLYRRILSGEILGPDAVSINKKFNSLRYISYGKEGNNTALQHLFTQLYSIWPEQLQGTKHTALYRYIRKITAFYLKEAKPAYPEIYEHLVIPFFRIIKNRIGFTGRDSELITVTYDDFVREPIRRYYLNNLLGLHSVGRTTTQKKNLLNEVLNWYTYDEHNERQNDRYFDLLPHFEMYEKKLLVQGNNLSPIQANWGIVYGIVTAHANSVYSNRIRETYFLKLPSGNAAIPVIYHGRTDHGSHQILHSYITSARYHLTYHEDGGTLISNTVALSEMSNHRYNNFYIQKKNIFNSAQTNTRFLLIPSKKTIDPETIMLFSGGAWLSASLTRFTFDGLEYLDNIFISDLPIENISSVQAFSGTASIPVPQYPVMQYDAKKNLYIAGIQKGSEKLMDLQEKGYRFFIVIRIPKSKNIQNMYDSRVFPAEVQREGDVLVLFKLLNPSGGVYLNGKHNFGLIGVEKQEISDEVFCLTATGKEPSSPVRFRKLDSCETEITFNAPFPEWLTRMIITDRVTPRGGHLLQGIIRKQAVNTEDGELYDGCIYLKPAVFNADLRRESFFFSSENKIFYFFPLIDNGVTKTFLHIVPENEYRLQPDYGSYFYFQLYNLHFKTLRFEQSRENLTAELGKKVAEWETLQNITTE